MGTSSWSQLNALEVRPEADFLSVQVDLLSYVKPCANLRKCLKDLNLTWGKGKVLTLAKCRVSFEALWIIWAPADWNIYEQLREHMHECLLSSFLGWHSYIRSLICIYIIVLVPIIIMQQFFEMNRLWMLPLPCLLNTKWSDGAQLLYLPLINRWRLISQELKIELSANITKRR